MYEHIRQGNHCKAPSKHSQACPAFCKIGPVTGKLRSPLGHGVSPQSETGPFCPGETSGVGMQKVFYEPSNVLPKCKPDLVFFRAEIFSRFTQDQRIFRVVSRNYYLVAFLSYREPMTYGKPVAIQSLEKLRRYGHSFIVFHIRTLIIVGKGVYERMAGNPVFSDKDGFEVDRPRLGRVYSIS